MDPITASQALRIIAQQIDLSPNPSISEITSELEQVLRYVESSDVRTAGPIDWMKGLKRKVLDTKGTKKILDKIDNLTSLMKWSEKAAKKIRNGEDIADIASDDDYRQVLEGASKYMSGGSDALELLWVDSDSFNFGDLDEHWLDNEDDEGSDRDIIVDAISEFHDKCKSRIQKNKKLLQSQKSRQKEKGLPAPKSKRRKPEPDEEESETPEPAKPEPAKPAKPAAKKPEPRAKPKRK